MIPEIGNEYDVENAVYYRQPSLTYKLNKNHVNGKVDKLEAVKQAIYHILSTERYSNPIYDDNYGVELNQYIGGEYAQIKANIEETLFDALTQDDRITGVIINDIENYNDYCTIKFTVKTIYGEVEESLNV